MRRSIATVSLGGTLDEKLVAAGTAGFDGVELFESDLIGCSLSPAQLRARMAEFGLRTFMYQPLRDLEAVPRGLFEENLRRATRKFELTQRLGGDMVLACSNVSEHAIDSDELAAGQLRELAERAAAFGIRIAYEALAWGRHVHTYQHSTRIVEAADHPNLGVCLDSFHILARGDDARGMRNIRKDKIFFVQLADAPQLEMDVQQWSRRHRCLPGQGAFDLRDFMEHLLASGYDGPLSLEIFNDVVRQASSHRTAVDAMRSLKLLEDSVTRCPGASNGDPRLEMLPAAPQLGRYSFVELGADPLSRSVIERMLGGLGFALVGQHSSAIAAPDATSIFFCDKASAGWRAWLDEFQPLQVDRTTEPELVTVDHVALSQPFAYFDEAHLFYRSVLGLEFDVEYELAGPDGLVRSRLLKSAANGVRLALDVPVVGGGSAHPARTEHVAFACRDIFDTARRLRARNVPVLPIPDNYYEDLAARVDLPAELLDEMREFDMLYDCDPRGEFFHFYTPLVTERLFFEVVQRTGGYDGYGAVNAAVRMAAQRVLVTQPTGEVRALSA